MAVSKLKWMVVIIGMPVMSRLPCSAYSTPCAHSRTTLTI